MLPAAQARPSASHRRLPCPASRRRHCQAFHDERPQGPFFRSKKRAVRTDRGAATRVCQVARRGHSRVKTCKFVVLSELEHQEEDNLSVKVNQRIFSPLRDHLVAEANTYGEPNPHPQFP